MQWMNKVNISISEKDNFLVVYADEAARMTLCKIPVPNCRQFWPRPVLCPCGNCIWENPATLVSVGSREDWEISKGAGGKGVKVAKYSKEADIDSVQKGPLM